MEVNDIRYAFGRYAVKILKKLESGQVQVEVLETSQQLMIRTGDRRPMIAGDIRPMPTCILHRTRHKIPSKPPYKEVPP
jgi:hypothetical protein